MKFDYKKLGLALQKIRNDLDWTGKLVAKKSDYLFKPGQISAYESGEKRIPLYKLAILLELYGIHSMTYFFSTYIEDKQETVNITKLDEESRVIVRRMVVKCSPKEIIEEKKKEKAPPHAKDPPAAKKQEGGQKP